MNAHFGIVADCSFFPGALACVASIKEHHPESSVTVVSSGKYNRSLTEQQIGCLAKMGAIVITHDKLDKPGRVLGAWQLKAYLASFILPTCDIYVGIDADAVLCSNVQDVIEQCLIEGAVAGGKDGGRVAYNADYQMYGIQAGSTNDAYISTSCIFIPRTQDNLALVERWAECSNNACYGPQQIKLFAGHGDQGVLNALMFKLNIRKLVLSNPVFSQHWTYDQHRISFRSGAGLYNDTVDSPQRVIHCGGSAKFWSKAHSDKMKCKGQSQIWSYAYWLRQLWINGLIRCNINPTEVIPSECAHLMEDAVNYAQWMQVIDNNSFVSAWSKIDNRIISELSKSVRRAMSLGGSMDVYKRLTDQLHNHATIVEVGSFYGGSIVTLAIMNIHRKLKYVSVESFMGNKDGTVDGHALVTQEEFCKNVRVRFPFLNISIIPLESKLAANGFENESIDMVFIDANHSYDAVTEDIKMWSEKVKTGGIISGDDIGWPDVRRAVTESFPSYKQQDGVWWVIK